MTHSLIAIGLVLVSGEHAPVLAGVECEGDIINQSWRTEFGGCKNDDLFSFMGDFAQRLGIANGKIIGLEAGIF